MYVLLRMSSTNGDFIICTVYVQVYACWIFRKCYSIISDQHEKCLNKGLRGHQSETDIKGFSGTEIAVTLAEHLLGKLAPGKSYVVDEKVKRKGKCRRGYEFCESDPMFGSTGIGMFCFEKFNLIFSSPERGTVGPQWGVEFLHRNI